MNVRSAAPPVAVPAHDLYVFNDVAVIIWPMFSFVSSRARVYPASPEDIYTSSASCCLLLHAAPFPLASCAAVSPESSPLNGRQWW